MNSISCIDEKNYEVDKEENTFTNMAKVYDMEENDLDYIALYKDTSGIVKNIQIKMRGSKAMIIYGTTLQIENLKQQYISFKMN
jgi:hypothetical protein